ncbi:hypothetical protein [Salinisphaera sp. C84B14]|uniref:hypothetical protein n=1 Tax=Salinisphaera sp. C84B14 TaxID=1304155 RepID=UPI00333F613C
MTTKTQQLPPHSAGLASVLSSHTTALQRAAVRGPESFLLLAVFAVVIGPVYAMTLWFVPQGIGALLAMYLLAAMSYVAAVVASMLLIHTEGRRKNENARSRLPQRWKFVRAEVGKNVFFGVVLLAAMDFVFSLAFGFEGPSLPGSAYTDDLVIHATAGAAMMAWAGHIRACVHLPQMMMLCRDQPVEALRKILIIRARERYDSAVTFGLLIPMMVAVMASEMAPVLSVLAWLHTAWYLHVTVSKAWLWSKDSHTFSDMKR